MKEIRLWDRPTRLFHWLLAASVGLAYVTGENGGNALVLHGRLGFFIIGLVSFRILWGLIGSTYARFTQFVRGPAAIRAYLAGQWHGVGHNPLGALSVLGLLALVSMQVATGLFAWNDDIGYAGPFHALVSEATGQIATMLHHKIVKVLLLLVGVHVGAIFFYAHVKKENLLRPMIHGRKTLPDTNPASDAKGGGPIAFLLALVLAGLAVWGGSGAWLPPPPPPAAVSAPAW